MTALWPHQQQLVQHALTHKGTMWAADMGTGKTRAAIELMRQLDWPKTLVIAPATVIRGVWPNQLEQWGDPTQRIGIIDGNVTARAGLTAAQRRTQLIDQADILLINYESVWRQPVKDKLLAAGYKLLILDECLPGDTLISTPQGDTPIRDIRAGDEVWGVNHHTGETVRTVVQSTHRRETSEQLIEVSGVKMTPEHPVWTTRGYAPAREVTVADHVATVQGVQTDVRDPQDQATMLLAGLRPQAGGSHQDSPETAAPPPSTNLRALRHLVSWAAQDEPLLQQAVLDTLTNHAGDPRTQPPDNAFDPATPRRAEETRSAPRFTVQPATRPGSEETSSRRSEETRVRAPERRQRKWPHGAAETSLGETRLANGVRGLSSWETNPLQDRHRRAQPEDRYRGGRTRTQGEEQTASGREENQVPRIARLGDTAILERGDTERSALGDRTHTVHNLETTTGNFIAGGLLVHNSHRIKAAGGVASRYITRLARRIPKRVAMTGTPMPNSPLDLYAQYRAIDRTIFGTSVAVYKARYAIMGGYEGREITGWRHQTELRQKYESIAMQVSATDVLSLPPTVDSTHRVTLNKKAKRLAREAEDAFLLEVETGTVTVANALVKLLRLQQISSGFLHPEGARPDIFDTSKRDALTEILTDLGETYAVVFCPVPPRPTEHPRGQRESPTPSVGALRVTTRARRVARTRRRPCHPDPVRRPRHRPDTIQGRCFLQPRLQPRRLPPSPRTSPSTRPRKERQLHPSHRTRHDR